MSVLALVEVPSAIWRKQRTGALAGYEATVLVEAFMADCADEPGVPSRFHKLAVTTSILERAGLLARDHALRAYDAVQLASALAAHEVDRGCDTLVAFDKALARAARAEGLETIGSAA